MTEIKFHADGACEPKNPGGYAGWSWVMYQDGVEVAHCCGCLGHGDGMTNNVAEYHAVGRALRHGLDKGHQGFTVYTDSQLVVNQANGDWACNAKNLIPLCERVRALMTLTGASLVWVRREQNERADELSKQACYAAMKQAA